MKERSEDLYGDIINLPHHQSVARPHMSPADRAAQFSPFAALTGYENAVSEAARHTQPAVVLAEDQLEILDEKLRLLTLHLSESPEISVTYFIPDKKKEGGRYLQHTGKAKELDIPDGKLIFEDKTSVLLEQITDIQTGFCD